MKYVNHNKSARQAQRWNGFAVNNNTKGKPTVEHDVEFIIRATRAAAIEKHIIQKVGSWVGANISFLGKSEVRSGTWLLMLRVLAELIEMESSRGGGRGWNYYICCHSAIRVNVGWDDGCGQFMPSFRRNDLQTSTLVRRRCAVEPHKASFIEIVDVGGSPPI